MGLRFTATLLLLLVQLPAFAGCGTGVISRAVLTDTITNREPGDAVSGVSDDTATLFAFTELQNAVEGTLHHRWYYGDELVADVALAIRGQRWRTWSSKNLGLRRDNNWSVRIVDGNDCELAHLSLMQPASPNLVDPILALLANGDIPAAKVQLAETIDTHPQQAQALRWQLQPAIALAQVAEQIEDGELYIAAARLAGIDTATREQAKKKARLRDSLATQRTTLDRQTAVSLSALERVFASRLTPCPLAQEQANDQLTRIADGQLTVIASAASDDRWTLTALDQRTGTSHDLNIACETVLAD